MQREIEFRAFDDGKMIYQEGALVNLGRFFRVIREDAIIMQYTGVQDKYGNKIFDRDIVANSVAKFYVTFENGVFGVRLLGETINSVSSIALRALKNIEVIGNIYETQTI